MVNNKSINAKEVDSMNYREQLAN